MHSNYDVIPLHLYGGIPCSFFRILSRKVTQVWTQKGDIAQTELTGTTGTTGTTCSLLSCSHLDQERGGSGNNDMESETEVWFLNRILRRHSFVPARPPNLHTVSPRVMFSAPAFHFSGLFPSNWVRPEHTTYESDCVLSSDAVRRGGRGGWRG